MSQSTVLMSQISVPISIGELIDKLTILEIKSERIADEQKLINIRKELSLLKEIWNSLAQASKPITELRARLKSVNEILWDIEDQIRVKEARQEFDEKFIELARAVYIHNDHRAALKRRINLALGSEVIEEKSYAEYASLNV
jgi:phenylalanyl-tRNA synthetase alpha subunit